MGIKLGKIFKSVIGSATSLIPFGGIVKSVLKLGAKKIPGASDVLEQVFNEAEAIYAERKDIREAYFAEMKEQNKFYIESEGRYSELRTKAESIIRSMQRPFLTVFCVVNLVIMIYTDTDIPQIFGIITAALVTSLATTKAIRDYKGKKNGNI